MINVYDFDKTIYSGDSTIDFYLFCLKKNFKIVFLIFVQLWGLLLYLIGIKEKEYFKEKFFCFLKCFENVDCLVNEFWDTHCKKINKWYLDIKKSSDVIISASPDFLLNPIAKRLNISCVIASKINSKTGKFISNNCYGYEKSKRLKEEMPLKKINNFYSDSYSDESLANEAKNAYMVKNGVISKWNKKRNTYKKEKKKFLIHYTFLFFILFYFCIEIYFAKHGKSYFRSYDGLDQHYLIFSYIGDLIRSFFSGNGFVMWNNGIGYGGDVLTSLSAYLYDPFNWISVFFSHEKAEFGFNLMIMLKFYFTGISFAIYGFYKKYDYKKILAGSLLYTFCSTMFIAFIESFFINPMYIFPFVIIGTDKLMKNENPLVYILSLAFSFINYFYFGYMTCIFVFFYFIINYFFDESYKRSIKNMLNIIKRFVIYSLVGVGLSAAVLMPVLNALLSINRLNVNYYLPILYNTDYYIGILKGFISFYNMGRDAILGFGFLSLACIILLFSKKNKEFLKLKIEFLILFIILLVPFLSTILNGFSYYTNRWVWCLAFLVCVIVCKMRDHFKKIDNNKCLIIEFICLMYTIILVFVFEYNSYEFIISSIVLLLFLIFVRLFRYKNRLFDNAYIFFIIVSLLISSSYYFRESKYNQTIEEVDRGTAYYSVYEKDGQELLTYYSNSDAYRYDDYGINKVRNSSWIYGRSGIDHYISIYNNDINIFNDEIGLLTSPASMDYRGLNRRTSLNYLMGVNYFVIKDGLEDFLPYSYCNKINTKKYADDSYSIYSPSIKPSIIYNFDKIINRNDYEKLKPYEKDEALMKYIVLDNEITNNNINIDNDEVNYKIILGNNIEQNGTVYNVKEDDKIDLYFNTVINSELYLNISNIDYYYEDIYSFNIGVSAYYNDNIVTNISSLIDGLNNKFHMFGNKKNYLLNLGYTKDPVNKISIYLKKGIYNLDNIIIYRRDKEKLDYLINILNSPVIDLKYDNNIFTSNIELNNDNYLLLTIPYFNNGWKAYLDNEEIKIYKADTAFMAVNVPKGKHKLVLKYRTPMLYEGIIISIISAIFCVIIIIRYKKNFRRHL